MNHIKALAIANSINNDRLEAATRRRYARQPAKPAKAPRQSHFVDMVRAYLVGFRTKAQPSR